jgi:hypothetical protein
VFTRSSWVASASFSFCGHLTSPTTMPNATSGGDVHLVRPNIILAHRNSHEVVAGDGSMSPLSFMAIRHLRF